MRTKAWFISIALSLVLGAGGGWYFQGHENIKQNAADQAPKNNELQLSLPELIANQIESGHLACPHDDPLTREACLLFQGALGTWQRVNMPDVCPDVVADAISPPELSAAAGRRITKHDVLRANQAPCFGFLYAIGIANLTPVLVSTSNRTFQMAPGHSFVEPGSNTNLCVLARHGICGNHAAVGLALFDRAGIAARPLEFYYSANQQRLSHIIVEAKIGGDWRPIDTTYGAYWTKKNQESRSS